MPYAAKDQISTSPMPGGVEITDQQYQQALAGISQGQIITVDGGFSVIDKPAPPEPEPDPEPTLEEKRASWTATAAQIRIALDEAGRLDEIEAIVAASSRRTQIWWEKGERINRLSPTLGEASALMTPPPTEEWWDALFAAAVAIET